MALGKLGKYERVDVLGHGVSGIVYLAWDTLLRKQVALKEVDLQAADMDRFLEEARVMDRLHHPNIVRVNGVDTIEGRVVIDMEYVKGQNLQELLRREGRLPLGRSLDIAIQTLDALDYAHKMQTVHRDVKPANILISRTGEVKLVDFGLAEILATNSYAGGAGTYSYMAPEDFSEQRHTDHQSDIWAVGVTLFEMLSGGRPFVVERPKDPFAWRRALTEQTPCRLPGLLPDESSGESARVQPPVGLQLVLDCALARDKRERYATAGDFRDDLVSIRRGRSPEMAERMVPGAMTGSVPPRNGDAHVPSSPERERPGYRDVPIAAPPSAVMSPPLPAQREALREQPQRHRLAALLRKKSEAPVRIDVEPTSVHFGEVRKGDERTTKVRLRVEGGNTKFVGRVANSPGWLAVSPPVFAHRKQTLMFTACSDHVWQTGDYDETVQITTSVGEIRIPVTISVLQPRKTFAEVAIWFVPLLLMTLLPAFTVAWGAQLGNASYLVAPAALGSCLLAAMLELVALEIDLGIAEKISCGVLMVVMAMLLGATFPASARHNAGGISPLIPISVSCGTALVLQLFNRRYWIMWSCAIVLLSLMASGSFATVLTGSQF